MGRVGDGRMSAHYHVQASSRWFSILLRKQRGDGTVGKQGTKRLHGSLPWFSGLQRTTPFLMSLLLLKSSREDAPRLVEATLSPVPLPWRRLRPS